MEPSYTVGRDVNWYSHCGTVQRFLRKLNMVRKLPYDLVIPFLIQKDTSTSVFIAALFTTA